VKVESLLTASEMFVIAVAFGSVPWGSARNGVGLYNSECFGSFECI